jgi:hypothetical protein
MTTPRLALCSLSLAAGLAAVFPSGAMAIDASGKTIAVIPAAAALGNEGRRILQVDGPIFMGDKVETGPVGEAQIEFRDNTRLVVGKNSLLTIDAFVFDERNTARKITMNASKGVFRFITGRSESQAYSINTPTATIGVRGTRFDFAVAPNGTLTFALFDGVARLCDKGGACRELNTGCAVAVVPPSGGVQQIGASRAQQDLLRQRLPYVFAQARLHPNFQVDTGSCENRSQGIRFGSPG